MHLKDRGETRKIAKVKDGNIHVNKKDKHVFQKLKAYGFNYDMLRAWSPSAYLIVTQENKTKIKAKIEDVLTQ